jgi:hypothetical protein
MFFNISLKSIAYAGLISNLALVYAKTDCDVLSDLFKGFKAESKISWKENTNSCCELSGIECSSDRITKIDLRENGFKGSISSEIGALSELNHLELRSNEITGDIPNTIASLAKLKYLNLSINKLNGEIPKSVCSLKNLVGLYFYTNQLKGSIPDCIGELTNINELCLDNNKLEGNIPSSIGNLSNLKLLDVEKNQLSGIIPESFSKLKNIEKINLQGNSGLIGNLPNVPSIKTCSYANTNLCVKEGSDICTNNLRKCTEDDFKKIEEFKANSDNKNNSNSNNSNNNSTDNNDSNNNSNDGKSGSGSGISVGVIILIIALVLLAIIGAVFFYRKKKNDQEEEDDDKMIRSLSKKNILPLDSQASSSSPQSPKPEKSFVVLSHVEEDDSLPPKLTIDENIFNYVDVNAKANLSLHEDSKISRASTGINQEQYQNQIQYQNLLNNQSYYLC